MLTTGFIRGFLSGLGLAPDPDLEDHYEESRKYPLVFNPDTDPSVLDEAAIREASAEGAQTEPKVDDHSEHEVDSEESESETSGDSDSDEEEDDEDDSGGHLGGNEKQGSNSRGKTKRSFTAVDKVRQPHDTSYRSEHYSSTARSAAYTTFPLLS